MWTKEAYTAKNYRGYGDIVVPKGTRLTHRTAMGPDPNYHFVDDLSWIKRDYPTVDGLLTHDVTYYGINVPKEFVTHDNPNETLVKIVPLEEMEGLKMWLKSRGMDGRIIVDLAHQLMTYMTSKEQDVIQNNSEERLTTYLLHEYYYAFGLALTKPKYVDAFVKCKDDVPEHIMNVIAKVLKRLDPLDYPFKIYFTPKDNNNADTH